MLSCLGKRLDGCGGRGKGSDLVGLATRTLLDLLLVFDAEDVHEEGGHGVAADPEELVDAVVEEVQTLLFVSTCLIDV